MVSVVYTERSIYFPYSLHRLCVAYNLTYFKAKSRIASYATQSVDLVYDFSGRLGFYWSATSYWRFHFELSWLS